MSNFIVKRLFFNLKTSFFKVNRSNGLTCMFGKTEVLAGRECPSTNNGTYECAVNKTLLNLDKLIIFKKNICLKI